jgi:hypothetical protein
MTQKNRFKDIVRISSYAIDLDSVTLETKSNFAP